MLQVAQPNEMLWCPADFIAAISILGLECCECRILGKKISQWPWRFYYRPCEIKSDYWGLMSSHSCEDFVVNPCLKTLWLSIITFRAYEWCNWHLTYRRRGGYSPNTQWTLTTVPLQLTMGNNKKRNITAPRERLDFCRMIALLLYSSHWAVCDVHVLK